MRNSLGSKEVTIDESLNPIIFLLGFKRHKVHAPLPAIVPGVEPIPLGVAHRVVIVLPAEPVEVPTKLLHSSLVYT